MSEHLPRRGMTPEALGNALDTAARTFRRIIFQAIDGSDVRPDFEAARRQQEGLLDYAALVVEKYCGPMTPCEGPDYRDTCHNLSLTPYQALDSEAEIEGLRRRAESQEDPTLR